MEAKEFYNLAVKSIEDIKNIEPQLVSGSDSEFCMIVTAKKQVVYAGVTSVKVDHGKIMRSCPEFNAIMAMTPSGETLIEKLITISFSTMEISQPCEECLKLLYQVNPNNKNTEVFTSPDKAVNAAELLNPDESSESQSAEEASGFAASAPAAAAPPTAMNQAPKNPLASASDFGDFAGGFDFEAAEPVEEPDEPEEEQKAQEQAQQNNPDNPFFNPAPPPDAAPQTMAQPYPGQPYPQQQPYGYPQQQPYGYPQQGYGQQQSMYIQPGQQSVYMQPGQQSMYIQPGQQSMYMQPGQQSMYIQPGQQSMYIQPGQQSMYVQPNQQSMYMGQSAHSQQVSAYQQSNYYSQPGVAPPRGDGSTFKNRLANFMDDSDEIRSSSKQMNGAANVDEKDLKKQAQERKKMAKLEATFKRKK